MGFGKGMKCVPFTMKITLSYFCHIEVYKKPQYDKPIGLCL